MLLLIALLVSPSTAAIWIRNRRSAGSSGRRGGRASAAFGAAGQKVATTRPPWRLERYICLTTTSHYLTTGATPASHGTDSLLRTTFGSLRDRARRSRAPHAAGAGALRPDDR